MLSNLNASLVATSNTAIFVRHLTLTNSILFSDISTTYTNLHSLRCLPQWQPRIPQRHHPPHRPRQNRKSQRPPSQHPHPRQVHRPPNGLSLSTTPKLPRWPLKLKPQPIILLTAHRRTPSSIRLRPFRPHHPSTRTKPNPNPPTSSTAS